MTSDIVERLRGIANECVALGYASLRHNYADAADAIESLGSRLDELREAAGKVTCLYCQGDGDVIEAGKLGPCPDCADLRRLLGEKP